MAHATRGASTVGSRGDGMVLGSGLHVQVKRYGGVSFVLSRCLSIGVRKLGSPYGSDGRSIGSLGAGEPNVGKDSGDGFRASTQFNCGAVVAISEHMHTERCASSDTCVTSEMQNLVRSMLADDSSRKTSSTTAPEANAGVDASST